jgi:hypothetical protein
MQKLCEITIPGLFVQAEYPAVRHRLLADFPDVLEVLPMTIPATVLVVYRGEEELDAWLDALSDSVVTRRMSRGGGMGAIGSGVGTGIILKGVIGAAARQPEMRAEITQIQ